MISEGAYVSVQAICKKWLLKKEKTIHSYWKVLTYAAEAVQFLKLTSMPLPQHKILSRPDGQEWFDLPAGFMHLITVGIPDGNSWSPIAVSDNLLPMQAFDGNTDLGAGLGAGFKQGAQINIGAKGYLPGPSFSPNNFSSQYFNTAAVPAGVTPAAWQAGVKAYDWDRRKTVMVDPSTGQIYAGSDFPGNVLYLAYVAKNTLSTMTHIPVEAEMAILAYCDWQYEYNKRRPDMAKAEKAYRQWIQHQKILRAMNSSLQSAADFAALLNWRYRGNTTSL